MPSRKHLQPIYELTSQATNIPSHIVKDVVNHQFKFLRSWVREPHRYAHLQIPQLGRFEYRSSSVYVKLRKLLAQIREEPTPELIKEFRFWWEFRLIANSYRKSRKQSNND